MYYIEKENKILLVDEDRQRLEDTITFTQSNLSIDDIKETDKEIENYLFVGSEEWIEWKSEHVREERDTMLVSEIDPIVSNPLRWETLADDAKQEYKNYRQYLLDFTKQTEWWTQNVLTFEQWTTKNPL